MGSSRPGTGAISRSVSATTFRWSAPPGGRGASFGGRAKAATFRRTFRRAGPRNARRIAGPIPGTARPREKNIHLRHTRRARSPAPGYRNRPPASWQTGSADNTSRVPEFNRPGSASLFVDAMIPPYLLQEMAQLTGEHLVLV